MNNSYSEGKISEEHQSVIDALSLFNKGKNMNEGFGYHIEINEKVNMVDYDDVNKELNTLNEEKVDDDGVYRININLKDDEEKYYKLEKKIRSFDRKISEDDNHQYYPKENEPINEKNKKVQIKFKDKFKTNCSKEEIHKDEQEIVNDLINEMDISKVKVGKLKDDKIYPCDLAVEIKKKNNFIINNNMIYAYEEEKGYYRKLSDYEFQQFIRKRLNSEAKRKVNTAFLKETINWFKTFDDIKKEINDDERFINFINGYYDLYNKDFYKTSRQDLYFGYFISAKYKKKEDDGYNFKKYIQNVTKGNYQLELLVQEVMGVALSNIRGFKKAIFIIGLGNTGKSTFLELLNNLIGSSFTSNLSLNDLNDKFRLAELANKRMNTCGEIAEIKLNRLDVFKSLTGNDIIMAERKGETPFNFKNTAMMLFSGNCLPKLSVTDGSNAFFKRMVIIPFNNTISESEKDVNLMDKLLKERNYIVKYAIEGVLRFMKNNYTFTNCKEAEEITKEYLYENASIQMFLEEECILELGAKVTSADLIDAYEEFCYEKQVNSVSEKALHKHIKGLQDVDRIRFRCKDGNLYGYKGIRLRD